MMNYLLNTKRAAMNEISSLSTTLLRQKKYVEAVMSERQRG